MPVKNIAELREVSNAEILNQIRWEASHDYVQNIPEATKANIREVQDKIWSYRPARNEFIDALVNKITVQLVRSRSWTNPLHMFKQGLSMGLGDTIEEVYVGLIDAHNYNTDRDYMEKELFGNHSIPVQTAYHSVNRQNFYPVSINEVLLRRAFLQPNGLGDFVSQILEAPYTSDARDEFKLMTSLFAEYQRKGGYWVEGIPHVSDPYSTTADAQQALRTIRATAGNLKFLSTKYNAAKMPMAVQNPSDLYLFMSPEFKSGLDVNALAAAFNLEYTEFNNHIVEVPKEAFGIDGCEAILTSKEFFIIVDMLLEMTSQYNPLGLNTNYFLHHQQIISTSLFAPAIQFNYQTRDVINMVPKIPSGISGIEVLIAESDGTSYWSSLGGVVGEETPQSMMGNIMQLRCNVEYENDYPEDNAVVWSAMAIPGNDATPSFGIAQPWITQDGVLHMPKSVWEPGTQPTGSWDVAYAVQATTLATTAFDSGVEAGTAKGLPLTQVNTFHVNNSIYVDNFDPLAPSGVLGIEIDGVEYPFYTADSYPTSTASKTINGWSEDKFTALNANQIRVLTVGNPDVTLEMKTTDPSNAFIWRVLNRVGDEPFQFTVVFAA